MKSISLSKLPDLKHIRTFLSVVKCEGFSAAAVDLNMTQPGVSSHLHKLEQTLGQQLLERYSRGILLTPAGKTFLPIALEILDQINQAQQTFEQENQQLEGWLRLGTPGPFKEPIIRSLISFRHQHPKLSISIKFQSDQETKEDLSYDRLDVGFITEPSQHGSLTTEEIYQDEIVLVGHRSSKKKRIKTVEDFLSLEFMDYPSRPEIFKHWIEYHFGNRKLHADDLNYSLSINDLSSGVALMQQDNSFGYSIAAYNALRSDNKLKQSIRIIPGPKKGKVIQPIYQALRSNQYRSRKVVLFTTHLKNFINKQMG